jgi:hypothetical protein
MYPYGWHSAIHVCLLAITLPACVSASSFVKAASDQTYSCRQAAASTAPAPAGGPPLSAGASSLARTSLNTRYAVVPGMASTCPGLQRPGFSPCGFAPAPGGTSPTRSRVATFVPRLAASSERKVSRSPSIASNSPRGTPRAADGRSAGSPFGSANLRSSLEAGDASRPAGQLGGNQPESARSSQRVRWAQDAVQQTAHDADSIAAVQSANDVNGASSLSDSYTAQQWQPDHQQTSAHQPVSVAYDSAGREEEHDGANGVTHTEESGGSNGKVWRDQHDVEGAEVVHTAAAEVGVAGGYEQAEFVAAADKQAQHGAHPTLRAGAHSCTCLHHDAESVSVDGLHMQCTPSGLPCARLRLSCTRARRACQASACAGIRAAACSRRRPKPL